MTEGDPRLIGEELTKISEVNWYNPEWIELTEAKNMTIYPEKAKDKLLELIDQKPY